MFNPVASTTIGALEQTLAFTERRQQLLAGNFANMSVPDYQTRDLDVGHFQTALAQSIRDGGDRRTSQATDAAFPEPNLESGELPNWVTNPFGLSQADGDLDESGLPIGEMSALSPAKVGKASTRDDRISGPRGTMEQVVYHDGSDFSLEQQVTQMSKNQHMHNLAVTTLRSQYELLRAAITERA